LFAAGRGLLTKGVLLLGAVVVLSSCTDYPPELVRPVPSQDLAPEFYRPEPESSYKVSSGDKLTVSSYYHPNLKQEVTVQPDGRVSLLLVGAVRVAGKTPQELSEELAQAYNLHVGRAAMPGPGSTRARLSVFVCGQM